MKSKVSTEYDGCKRVLYKLQCAHCCKDYWRPKKELETSKCCSKDCWQEWRQKTGKRVEVSCNFCNNKFQRFQHKLDSVESKRYFCSRECQKEASKKKRGNCINCASQLKEKATKYCSFACQWGKQYKENIDKWKDGELSGLDKNEGLCVWLRKYILDKYNSKCSQCGWSEINQANGKIPVQIDHIDGDYTNNKEENLRVLCPNCHSLTPTYGALNLGKGRKMRREARRNTA